MYQKKCNNTSFYCLSFFSQKIQHTVYTTFLLILEWLYLTTLFLLCWRNDLWGDEKKSSTLNWVILYLGSVLSVAMLSRKVKSLVVSGLIEEATAPFILPKIWLSDWCVQLPLCFSSHLIIESPLFHTVSMSMLLFFLPCAIRIVQHTCCFKIPRSELFLDVNF